jgi:hypothetical protein
MRNPLVESGLMTNCTRLSLVLCALMFGFPAPSLNAGQVAGIEPNTVRWATASEKDNFGYDVYRGLSESGPFERINQDTIPGAGTTDIPQSYEYIDSAIQPDVVYWYYVESISLNGDRQRMTPIYPSTPKIE